MFKIKQSPLFFWPVEFNIPADGGKFDKQTMDVQFKRLHMDEIQALQSKEGMTDAEFCRAVVVGWKGVVDPDGQTVEFSVSALDDALSQTSVATTIVVHYHQAMAGLKRKN